MVDNVKVAALSMVDNGEGSLVNGCQRQGRGVVNG